MTQESTTQTGHPLNQEIEAGKEHFRQAAESFRHAAELKAAELRQAAEARASELRSVAESKAAELKERARTLSDDAEAYVRENPLRAVATALGVGFVLGMIFRK
ncbi:MAG: hypothetical protein SNJ52_03040 [Verrucomicrobiia bacterium]